MCSVVLCTQVQATLKLPRIHRQQQQDAFQAPATISSSSSPTRGRPGQLTSSNNPRSNSSSPVRKAAGSSGDKSSGAAAGGKLVPTTRTTLRQQAAYDAVKQARALETRVDRAQVGARDTESHF
jgi:hypothetical protein